MQYAIPWELFENLLYVVTGSDDNATTERFLDPNKGDTIQLLQLRKSINRSSPFNSLQQK